MATNNSINTSKVSFLARCTSQPNITGDATTATIIFDDEIFDEGSNYDHTTGLFVAPVDGIFLFNTTVSVVGVTGSSFTHMYALLGMLDISISKPSATPEGYYAVSGSSLVALNKGDAVSVWVQVIGGTKTVGANNMSKFSGCQVL